MVQSLLFVHGTGARGATVDAALALVKAQAAQHLGPAVDVQGCAWGDVHGATLALGAASVPGYEQGRPVVVNPSADERSAELRWGLLFSDPLYELRTYAAVTAAALAEGDLGGSDLSAHQQSRAARALEQLAAFQPSHGGVARAGHLAVRLNAPALATLHAGDTLEHALQSPPLADAARGRPVVARSFVAAWLAAGGRAGLPALDGDLRDSLVQDAMLVLGGAIYGLKDELLGALAGLASRIATPLLRRNRSAATDASVGAINDILLYQTEHGGQAIRGFIEQRIRACRPPVLVVAHSLGGIASVELLARTADLPVAALVTCGSQAPFLYETDALGHLRRGNALPGHFPRWFNVYDLNDMLSYAAGGVFSGRADDFEVRSRQPFPQCHSAYWSQDKMWQALKTWLGRAP